MGKLASVIVPVYNAEKYIGNCIQAILKQTYKNFELILVDDGSKDQSLLICNALKNTDSRIKVIHKENGGVSSARNRGIEESTGFYVLFADSDDIPDPKWMENLIGLSEQWKVNFVICGYRIVKNYHEAIQPIVHEMAFEPNWIMTREEFFQMFGYMMTFRDTLFAPWNKLYLKDILDNQHIRFPEDMQYGEDFIFNLQYINYCNGLVETRDKLYNYIFQNPLSLESIYKPDLFENQTRLYHAAQTFLITHNMYSGYNVTNLAYYYTNRVIASIKNQFSKKNIKREAEKRKYVESIVKRPDVVESAFLVNIHENREQSVFTDLIKSQRYNDIYDALRNIQKSENTDPCTVRYKKIPEQPYGWHWIHYTFTSVKEFGLIITIKRIAGKIFRKLRKK